MQYISAQHSECMNFLPDRLGFTVTTTPLGSHPIALLRPGTDAHSSPVSMMYPFLVYSVILSAAFFKFLLLLFGCSLWVFWTRLSPLQSQSVQHISHSAIGVCYIVLVFDVYDHIDGPHSGFVSKPNRTHQQIRFEFRYLLRRHPACGSRVCIMVPALGGPSRAYDAVNWTPW